MQLLPIIALWVLLPAHAGAQERYPAESWMRYAVPEEAGWSSERIAEAQAFADSVGTAAFMLVHDGAVVATFGDYARRYQAHSVRKSLLSGLFGIYVAEGRIDLESTLADLGIDDRLPLTPMEKRARVVDLLTARSGVYHPAAYSAGRAASRPERGSHEPGTFWYYNNWDFNTLGEIFRRRTGLGVFDAFERRIADPLRMKDFRLRDGYYHSEPHHSNYPAYPFRMSARDLARFGLLFEREGRWEKEQIIPASWIRESTRSYSEVDRPGIVGYGYMWSVLGGELGKHGAFAAMGVGAQTITVVPGLRIVFVHRVDTYADGRVPIQAVLDLLDRLLAARSGEARADPALVRLEDPEPGAGLVRLPDELRQRYARTYTYPSGRTVDVSLRDGELVAHGDRLGTFGLLPLTDRQFLIEDARTTAFFVPVSGGDSITFVQEMILRSEASDLLEQGRTDEAVDISKRAVEYYPASAGAHRALGRVLLASGDTAAAKASYRRTFELDPGDVAIEFLLVRLAAEGFEPVQPEPEALDVYVGRYRIREGDTLTVSREGERLLVAPPGVAVPQTLVATSDTVFFLDGRAGPVKLIFTPGESGRISEVGILLADGQEFRAEKISVEEAGIPRTRTLPGVENPAFPYAEPEEVGLSSRDLQQLADSVARRVSAGELVGAEILVIKAGRTVLHEAIGWSDRDRGIPLQRNSIYRIRSMTKPFVGTAVLMLAEEGKLGLDDHVADYLPSFDNGRSRSITIRELLTHTSGLRDHGFLDIGLPRRPDEYDALRALVDDIGEIGPLEPRGSFHYSDSGSATLAALVGEIAVVSVEDFIATRILDPLGLTDTHTRFAPGVPWAGRMNSTYRWAEEEAGFERYWDNTMEQHFRYFEGSGGLYSTVTDYATFLTMWMNRGRYGDRRLLSEGAVEAALRPLAGGQYGMHWGVPRTPIIAGMPLMFGHGGSDGTLAIALPALDAIVLYFTQSRGPGVREPFRFHLSRLPGFEGHVASSRIGMLVADGDVPAVALSAGERSRYPATYVGSVFVGGEERLRDEWTYEVRLDDDGLLGYLARRGIAASGPIPSRHHLIHTGDGAFMPGRMVQGRVVEILPGVRVRFSMSETGGGVYDRVEIQWEGEPVFWTLTRQE
jgi:CubicO group peptidase (beta-lactamase class C family)